MKKSLLVLPLIACAVILSSCKKEDAAGDPNAISVSTDQKAFVLKFSATWCPPCGANAVPISQDLHTNYPYTVMAVSMQCGSSGTPDYTMPSNNKAPGHNSAQSAYNVTGIPTIIVGTKIMSTTYAAVSGEVNTHIGKPTTAGIGLKKELNGNVMTINYKVKFFNDFPDGAKLAIYVIENNVPITSQAGNPSCKELSNVFRGVPTGFDWKGVSLATGSVAKDQIYEGTCAYTLISDVKNSANLEVVGVLYSNTMNGNVPAAVINANSTVKH